jgi:hypothetical protein
MRTATTHCSLADSSPMVRHPSLRGKGRVAPIDPTPEGPLMAGDQNCIGVGSGDAAGRTCQQLQGQRIEARPCIEDPVVREHRWDPQYRG